MGIKTYWNILEDKCENIILHSEGQIFIWSNIKQSTFFELVGGGLIMFLEF